LVLSRLDAHHACAHFWSHLASNAKQDLILLFKGFALDRCASCEGIWLEKGQLAAILTQAVRGPLGAFRDRCFAKGQTGK
jgi:Zn-finger nucleic acid-binding protein